jgi:hypothetical protein
LRSSCCWFFLKLWNLDRRCLDLFTTSEQETIALPANCEETKSVPTDAIVEYLENRRKERGLVFKKRITCKGTPHEFDFLRDSRWLASYVPQTYEFRRTVVIFPYAPVTSRPSSVVAMVCLMPTRIYISLIAGQGDGKYAVWK